MIKLKNNLLLYIIIRIYKKKLLKDQTDKKYIL